MFGSLLLIQVLQSWINDLDVDSKMIVSLRGLSILKTSLLRRSLLTTGCCGCWMKQPKRGMFWEQTRRGHLKYTKLDKEIENVDFDVKVKYGAIVFWEELKLLMKEFREFLKGNSAWLDDGDVNTVWKFDSDSAIKEWRIVCDQDWDEGFSNCSFTRSPAGYGLFSGYTDSETLPKDRTVSRVGWCNISSPYIRRSFFREGHYEWEPYTHLVMRVRGDGRTYAIAIRTPGTMDVSWFDLYSFGLYTHGGPYWQFVRIPFSRFFLSAKGSIQDYQEWIPMHEIKSLGITIIDKNTGPFKLEIDYIGVEFDGTHDRKTVYESYYVPQAKFIGH